MSDTKHSDLVDELKASVHRLLGDKGSVMLFGSRARGDNKPQSDYDFLISKGEIHSLLQYAAFVAELEELLGMPVDVITDTSDDEYLINTAENEGIEIYGNK